LEPLTDNPVINKLCEINIDELGLSGLSQDALKERVISMFIDTYVNNGMLNNHLSSPEAVYDYFNSQIPLVDYLFIPNAGGFTAYNAQDIGYENNTVLLNPYYLENIDSLKNIVFHEFLHVLTHTPEYCGIMQKEQGDKRAFGQGLNEGITEYITQKHVPMPEDTFSQGNYSFKCSNSYPEETTIARELAILVGEDSMLADYFSKTPINNMYNEIYKYDIHNPMKTLANDNIKMSNDFDTSRKALKDIMKYTDIVNNRDEQNQNREAAFNSVHEVIYNLMEQQFEYAKQPGNEHELKQVNKKFKELYKVFPKFKDNEKLNLANLNPELAKQVDRQEAIKEFFGKIKTQLQSLKKEQPKALPEKGTETIDNNPLGSSYNKPNNYSAGRDTMGTHNGFDFSNTGMNLSAGLDNASRNQPTLADQIRGTAPTKETVANNLEDKPRSQTEQNLIDSIRGMSEVDYSKYQEQQSTTELKQTVSKGKENNRGNSIHNISSQPGGMER